MLLVAGLAAAAAVSAAVFIGVASAVFLVGIWRWPNLALEAGVMLTLLVRPCVDVFSERRLGLGPFAPNPSVVLGLAVLGIAGVHAVRRARAGISWWPERGVWHAHFFLFAAYSIALVSGARLYGVGGFMQGIREVIRVGSIVAAFFVVLWWVGADRTRYRRGWAYVLVGLVVPISVGLWQLVTATGFLETAGLNRLQGTFSHPNSFGLYLVPFVLITLGTAVRTTGVQRLLALLGAAGLTLLILLTYSRTALLVLAMGLLVLPALHARQIGIRGMGRSFAVVLVLVAVGWLLAGNLVRQRFADLSLGRSALDAAQSGASENSYEWRLINWSVLIGLGLEHPWTGHGAGMTTVLNPIVNTSNGVPYNAHNDFVRFFFECGLLGLLSYLIYAVLLCRWTVHWARAAAPEFSSTALAIAAAWLSLLLLSVGNTELSLNTAILYTMYGMLALVIGACAPTAVSVSAAAQTIASDR